ncbi:MAG: hypothetical protein P8H13_01240 [Polaribacter sp.]|mgnify:CR=1 FL=1|nr:hypothetical protein [Polaribacter sp.]MDG1810544.1 hypothetical protein [Polaribacter sp.]MDG1993384.1 hypothetical protein [Polaribacter sp.]
MKKFISKPHLFFFGLVPLFIILGLIKKDALMDVNISYVYFELAISTLCYLSAIFFSLIGLNYFSVLLSGKKLKKGLTITHIILQLIAFIPFIYLIISINNDGNISSDSKSLVEKLVLFLFIGFFFFLLSILIHLINFFSSLFLKTK